jgi:hypothetical protein
MQWCTVDWWRWRLAQARGRNPLVRSSDRVEVAIIAIAVVLSLAVVPFAGAIGTAVHDDHARTYAAQQHDRHHVPSTTTDRHVRWPVGDVEHAGNYPVRDIPTVGTWVDQQGRRVAPPTPVWQAGVDAVVAAVGSWLAATAVVALLVAGVRQWLRHTRYVGWNREIASLVHDDGGTANRRR